MLNACCMLDTLRSSPRLAPKDAAAFAQVQVMYCVGSVRTGGYKQTPSHMCGKARRRAAHTLTSTTTHYMRCREDFWGSCPANQCHTFPLLHPLQDMVGVSKKVLLIMDEDALVLTRCGW